MLQKNPQLPPIDEPISARQLNSYVQLDEHARSLATRQLPAPQEINLAESEQLVVEICEQRIGERNSELYEQANTVRQALLDQPDIDTDRNLAHLPAHVTNLSMKAYQNNAPAIRTTVAFERDAKAELNGFRDKHQLNDRQADYPPYPVQHWAFVIVFALVEAVCNIYMYLDATANGILGAFATAVMIAATNIALAVLLGLLPLRYLNLPNPKVKLWAYPVIATATSLIFFLNLIAAHYREVAATEQAFNEADVLSHLLNQPLDLSLQSLILMIVGLLFAVLGVWKGYTASDCFPGYERVHRKWEEAREDVDYLKLTIHGELDSIRDKEIVYVADNPETTQALLSDAQTGYNGLLLKAKFNERLDEQDIKAITKAIKRFRLLNTNIRTDGQVPAYFTEPLDFTDLINDGTYYNDLPQLISEAKAANHAHATAINNMVRQQLTRIEAAKDNTLRFMGAIERSYVDENALPDLSELRALIENPETANNTGAVSEDA